MKNVTIKRSKWQRGGDDAQSERFDMFGTTLWDSRNNCGCCLGHVLHQAHGVSYKTLENRGSPASVANSLGRKNPLAVVSKRFRKETVPYGGPTSSLFDNGDFANKAMELNDMRHVLISDSDREEHITKLARSYGYNITFKD